MVSGSTDLTGGSGGGAPTGVAGGDLGGNYPNPSVATVGTSSAANVHAAEALANAATNANTPSTIVKRDVSGNFAAGTITAALTGAASLNVLSSAVGAASGVASLDSSGLVPVNQIPPAAIERLVVVANQAARFALTTATVQNGDTVSQTDTGLMYYVIDQTNLGNSAGYAVYTAGTASAVAWGGITGIPAPVSALSGTNTGDQTFNGLSPMTTVGDMIVGGASGAAARLAAGAARLVLTGQGAGVAPIYQAPLGTIQSKSANYTVLSTDGFMIGDATSAAFTFTLPTGATGVPLKFKKKDSDTSFNAITITDGTFSTTLNTSGETVCVVWTGSAYEILDRRIPSISTAYVPTYTGFGTVSTSQIQYKRIGDGTQISGFFVSGTSTATQARLSLPSGLTSADTTKIPSSRIGGYGERDAVDATRYPVLVDPSQTYVTFGEQGASNVWGTKLNGSSFLVSGDGYSFNLWVPILGWNG